MGIITLNKTFKIMELFEGHFMHAGNCFQLTAQTKYEWDNKGYKAQKWMKGGCSTVKFHETEKWNKYFDLRSNKPLDTLPYVTAYRFEPKNTKESVRTEGWGGVDTMHMLTHHGKNCFQVKGAAVRKAALGKKMEAYVSKDGLKLVNGSCCHAGPGKWCK